MNRLPALPLATTFVLGFAAAASSQTVNPPPAPPPAQKPPASAGLLNDWLREDNEWAKRWDFGGQLRARVESKKYYGIPGKHADFKANGNSDNTYLLLREKVHVGYNADLFGFYVEGRDSSSQNDDRDPNPESDTDLHQAFVTFGNTKQFPLTAKIGRQELSYGDERVIGAADWVNVGRIFDAAKLRYEVGKTWVDAFVSRPVVVDDNNFNTSNDYETFSGVYASSKSVIPKQESQLYFLARNVERDSPRFILPVPIPGNPLTGPSARDIYTIGTRWKSLPGAYGAWDYGLEAAYQFGRWKAVSGDNLDHSAFAAHVMGGYTFTNSSLMPRIGLEYNYATGDSDPSDHQHETFDNLFPTNHKFYGQMDFVSWQNIHNVRLATSIKPTKKLTITADLHGFWLADTDDFFYQVNGAPRQTGGYGINSSASQFVGAEIDLIATYAVKPYAAVQAGYGHFFAADYIEDSLGAGNTKDADWIYGQIVFNF